jgi:hypothetical protein
MAEAVAKGTGASVNSSRFRVRWYRAAAIGFSLGFLTLAAGAAWANDFWPYQADYVSFWAAGRLTLNGNPSLAYDIAAHHAVEQLVGHLPRLLPFPYPPPFLALVSLFALLPYGASFYLWVIATAAVWGWAARRFAPPAYALAIPSVHIDYLSGQTGFLTSGILIAGLSLIEVAPWLAGSVLGLMVIKPHLALLLPVAMLAGREWRVIGGAAASAAALLLGSLLLFGWNSWSRFFDIVPHYVAFVRESFWPWSLLASPFALARDVGLSQTVALGIHAAIAAAATLATVRAWRLGLDTRVPILATATLLVPPYLLTYDTVLLAVPLVWLIREGRHPFVAAAAWLCCLCSILNHFTGVVWPHLVWPNLISVAAVLCLWELYFHSRIAPGTDAAPARRITAAEA